MRARLIGMTWVAALAYACGTSKAGPGADVTCMPPTGMSGSSDSGSGAGSGSMEGSIIYQEACSDGKTYVANVTCPYGECDCAESTARSYTPTGTVPFDCDGGTLLEPVAVVAGGAFAACGFPH